MDVPLLIPRDRLRLDRALDWFHTGHHDHSGFDWIAERARRDHPVRTALAGKTLKAWLLTEEGQQIPVPHELWTGRFLWPEAYSGGLVRARVGGDVVAGYLVVDADAFASFVGAGDASAPHQSLPSLPAYVPPYLACMLELVERFDLTEGYDFSHKSLVAWILDNADEFPAGTTMSGNKAKLIATFLGDPRSERGGTRPAKPRGRDPDPRKPFNGVNYPKPRR